MDVETTGTARRGGVRAVVRLPRYVIWPLFGFVTPVCNRALSPLLSLFVF